jgi:hypothetical protein
MDFLVWPMRFTEVEQSHLADMQEYTILVSGDYYVYPPNAVMALAICATIFMLVA